MAGTALGGADPPGRWKLLWQVIPGVLCCHWEAQRHRRLNLAMQQKRLSETPAFLFAALEGVLQVPLFQEVWTSLFQGV